MASNMTIANPDPSMIALSRGEGARVSRQLRMGRRPHSPEPVVREIDQLMLLARSEDPAHVQRFFNTAVSRRIDEELEAMASWVAGEWDVDLDTDRVRTLISKGQHRMAINAIIAQMRKEIVAELRRNKREAADKFLDECVVEE